MTTNQSQVQQQVTLTLTKKPENKGKTNPVHRQHQGEKPCCGDMVELTLTLDKINKCLKLQPTTFQTTS
ncbi:MAG: hypothetical protein V7L01_03255 [Nostoc sp.]|uniref:hypothetical protein n=1 Tax=Nostoc sp. TaxID=1180 RepID=UPI002FF98AA5